MTAGELARLSNQELAMAKTVSDWMDKMGRDGVLAQNSNAPTWPEYIEASNAFKAARVTYFHQST